MPRKYLATIVLDKYLKKAPNTIVIESPEKLASKNNKNYSLLVNLASI
jgi:hypothetical protein